MLSVSLRLFDCQYETYDNVAHLHDASYVAMLNDPEVSDAEEEGVLLFLWDVSLR